MFRRRPRATTLRRALAVAWVAVLAPAIAIAPAPAGASAVDGTGLSSWLADTAADALRAAQPDNDLAAGGRQALNHGVALALSGLQQIGPAWLRRITVDLRLEDDLRVAYDIAATQPLLRSWRSGELLWLQGELRHDPNGRSRGELGMFYRPRLLDHEVTLGLSGAVEDRWLLDYRRYALGATVRSPGLELSASLFDDIAGRRLAEQGVPDRRLDGYDVALAAEVPALPWARVQARRRWQIAVAGEQASQSDRLSLQIKPLAPLELEAGTAGDGEQRSWFAKLRFRIELGGGA